MYLVLFTIISGIVALGIGAEMIVRCSVNLANIYKISGYFIGFTVVALGTSLPELAATIQAINVVDSAFAMMIFPTLISCIWLAPVAVRKAEEYFASIKK